MSRWTLAELVGVAGQVLASDDVRVASGRVTEVPNERLVRWYTTIGLVERPTIGRGRLARYGERQLAQLVAVKRLQAQGLPLVEIQQCLLGATDEELRRIADLPAELPPARPPTPIPAEYPGDKSRVGAPTPVRKVTTKPGVDERESVAVVAGIGEEGDSRSASQRPAPALPVPSPDSGAFWEARPTRRTNASASIVGALAAPSAHSAQPVRQADAPAPVFGVTLSGLTLLLRAQPNATDLEVIASAAAPLIELLASRGLVEPNGDHQ